jgi:hypothetical protein
VEKKSLVVFLILLSTTAALLNPSCLSTMMITTQGSVEGQSNVAVAVYSAAFSPESNITTWLINHPIWGSMNLSVPAAASAGKPWMKQGAQVPNPVVFPPSSSPSVAQVEGTTPRASMTAKVHRTDVVPGSILVYVTWTGTTVASHTEEFGFATQLMDPGEDLNFGPVNIADVAPLVGMYEVWLNAYVLADNAVNINVGGTASFHSGYFYMKGYCDINGDNVVDGKDFVLVKKAIPSTPGSAKWNWMADVNCNFACTAADYQLVKTKIPTVYTPA